MLDLIAKATLSFLKIIILFAILAAAGIDVTEYFL